MANFMYSHLQLTEQALGQICKAIFGLPRSKLADYCKLKASLIEQFLKYVLQPVLI